MIRWILGKAGTGKTTKIIEQAAGTARLKKPVLVLVPEQFSFDMERQIAKALSLADALRVEVYSFTRLCDRIFRELGGTALQNLDENARVLVMHQTLEQMKGELHVFSRAAQSGTQIQALASLMEEFRAAAISPDMLFDSACLRQTETADEKILEIAKIYRVYDGIFHTAFDGVADPLQTAAEKLREQAIFSQYHVFVDSFKGFMADEFLLLEQLMSGTQDMTFSFCCDRLFDEQDFYSVFSPVQKTIQWLLASARKHHLSVAAPEVLTHFWRYEKKALAALSDKLFSPSKREETNSDGVHLISAKSYYDEIRFVAAQIANLVRSGGCRYQDIVVIGRDIEHYEQPVRLFFEDYEIPYFFDRRFDLGAQSLSILILEAMQTVCTGFSTEHIFRLLKTRLLPFSQQETAMLEEYAYVWSINGKDWKSAFTKNPAGFAKLREKDNEQLQLLESLRKKLIDPLLALEASTANCTATQLVQGLYRYLHQVGAVQTLKDWTAQISDLWLRDNMQNLYDAILDLWDQYAVVLGDKVYPIRRHHELMQLLFSQAEVGQIPQTLDMLTIGDAKRMRPLDPKYVFVIGANEGVFPASVKEDGVLSRWERLWLLQNGLEISPPVEQTILEEQFFGYTALCCASSGVFLSWVAGTAGKEEMTPSVLVEEVKQLFPSLQTEPAHRKNAAFYIANPASALFEYSRETDAEAGEKQAIERFLQQSAYRSILEKMQNPVQPQAFAMHDPALSEALFGKNLVVSPSKMDRFYQCKFAYFCERGLGVRKPRKAELSPIETGTVVHHVLQVMLERYPGKELTKLSEEDCKTQVAALLQEYFLEFLGEELQNSARFLYLLSRIEESLTELLLHLAAEFSVSDFAPVAFELPIGSGETAPPVLLHDEEGRTVSLQGIVDRVDCMEKDGQRYLRVVDYKTGSKTFSFTDVYYGLNLQMFLYLFALTKEEQSELQGSLPAGVLYMPGKVGYIPAAREDGEEKMRKLRLRTLKMNGLLLSDPKAILGMEKDGQGIFVPAKIKNGEIDAKSSVVSLEELGKLYRFIQNKLLEMAKQLHSGQIAALPVKQKNFLLCDYCDYKTVCMHQQEDAVIEMQTVDKKAFFDQLEGEQDGENGVDTTAKKGH